MAGDRARDRGDWAMAGINYRAALDANPGLGRIWVQYGHALKETGELSAAEAAYRTAIDRDATAADPYLQLGHVLKLQNRIPQAVEAYFSALTRAPKLHFPRAELLALGYSASQLEEKIETAAAASEVELDLGGVPIDLPKGDDLLARRVAAAAASRSGETFSAFPSFCILELNTRSVIGWAFLPFEFHHTPLVSVYRFGQLVATGLSNRARPEGLTEGPKYNWFEIVWANWGFVPSQAGLSELVFQRGEDGRLCANPCRPSDENGSCMLRVVDLIGAEAYDVRQNTHFVSQLTDLSALAIIHLYYLDYLGRPVDSQGLDTYLQDLNQGRLSVDALRQIILGSDEFRRRGVRVSDRLGQVAGVEFLSLYRDLAFDRSPPLRRYETLSADLFSTEDDSEFLRLCCSRILHLPADDASDAILLRAALKKRHLSRVDVMRETVLDAAAAGRFIKIGGLTHLAANRASADEVFEPAGLPVAAHAAHEARASVS
jgi:hypothetical protein